MLLGCPGTSCGKTRGARWKQQGVTTRGSRVHGVVGLGNNGRCKPDWGLRSDRIWYLFAVSPGGYSHCLVRFLVLYFPERERSGVDGPFSHFHHLGLTSKSFPSIFSYFIRSLLMGVVSGSCWSTVPMEGSQTIGAAFAFGGKRLNFFLV